jgi:hypothetical protein
LTVWKNTHGNVATCAALLDGSATPVWVFWLTQAFLLEASARDALGDRAAAGRALERALDLAEPDGWLLPFLLHPARRLLERHARHRTAHAALIAEILGLLAGNRPALPPTGRKSPVSCLSRSTPSRRMCATCTPSSAPTAGPRPSSGPATWVCSLPPHAALTKSVPTYQERKGP